MNTKDAYIQSRLIWSLSITVFLLLRSLAEPPLALCPGTQQFPASFSPNSTQTPLAGPAGLTVPGSWPGEPTGHGAGHRRLEQGVEFCFLRQRDRKGRGLGWGAGSVCGPLSQACLDEVPPWTRCEGVAMVEDALGTSGSPSGGHTALDL